MSVREIVEKIQPLLHALWVALHDLAFGTPASIATIGIHPDVLDKPDGEADDERENIETTIVDNENQDEPQANAERLPASQKKERRDPAPDLRVMKRAEEILLAAGQDPLAPTELIELITNPPALSAQRLENMALSRLLRGFSHPKTTWHVTMRPYIEHASPTHVDFCELSTALDERPDLMRRDVNLSQTHAAADMKTYLADIIHKMETIKYNTELFQRQNEDIFEGLTGHEKAEKMADLSAQFKRFKKLREQLITARNRLYFSYMNFGTGVIVDPFFTTANLGDKRAHKFQSLLDTLVSLAPEAANPGRTLFHNVESTNREVLYMLTAALCSSEREKDAVAEWIDNFFMNYPSHVGV
ncbi:hypothetical protein B0H17DRAFT_1213122 [Mycena rosella]|uniref:Uncharacterized protein n=1 Tax=Mycena rosella TaxID=1033263 RepID=A0AAD7G1P7_MYCRO|nr:hypothetical protein B0H17DRAFT_1213122 [Mycena rosella]